MTDEPLATPPPKFCRRCGTAWHPEWTACPVCEQRDQQGQHGTPPLAGGERPIVSSLALYFALLLTTLAAILVEGDEATTCMVMQVADAVIVLVWVAAVRSQVSGALRTLASGRWYAAAVGLGGVTFLVATMAIEGLVRVFGIEELFLSEPLVEAGYGWRTVVLFTCVQPAVVEELAFRGVVLSAMRRVMSSREAILVSALLFMTIHLAVASFAHLFLIGVVLGWLRTRSGSLYPCMVLHFTHNLLCILAEYRG